MARFAPTRTFRAPSPDAEEDGETAEGLPLPLRLKLQSRRAAAIAEAKAIVGHLPEVGESVHVLFSRRIDLTDVLNAVIDSMGKCRSMTIATLGYSKKNLKTMLRWLDNEVVGNLTLMPSEFFRAHNRSGLWAETQEEFAKRGQRTACAHSHAKVTVMRFVSGANLCTEGSSNLCSSGSGIEAVSLVRDDSLCDWHERWIEERVSRVS